MRLLIYQIITSDALLSLLLAPIHHVDQYQSNNQILDSELLYDE